METDKGRQNLAFMGDDGGALKESATESVKRSKSKLSMKLESTDQSERLAAWDVFRDIPEDQGQGRNDDFYNFWNKVFKVICICVAFVFILACALLSKATLLFVTSQIRQNITLVCNSYYTDSSVTGNNNTQCIVLPEEYVTHPNVTVTEIADSLTCLASSDVTGASQSVMTSYNTYCSSVTVRWLWCLLLIIVTPYLFVFLRSAWNCCFKTKKNPTLDVFFFVFGIETIYTIGISIFAFRVLPLVDDALHALCIMAGIAFWPSVLKVFNRPQNERLKFVQLALDVVAVVVQVSALILIPIVKVSQDEGASDLVWATPVSIVLLSAVWWENYVDKDTKFGPLTRHLVNYRRKIYKSRYKIYLVLSLWKIALTIVMMMALISREISPNELFNLSWGYERCGSLIEPALISGLETDWVFIWIINFTISWAGYMAARTAAKINIQLASYATPLALATPAVFATLIGFCETHNSAPCEFSPEIPSYLFFKCYPRGRLGEVFSENQGWVLILWWLAQLWITRHVWMPGSERLLKTERIFVMPLYDGLIIEQWLLHNRYRKDVYRITGKSLINRKDLMKSHGHATATGGDLYFHDISESTDRERQQLLTDSTPRVYICATMWHENEKEMIYMLKSIFRLDIDQSARKNAQLHLGVDIPDYYEFEAHIFFDDAMEAHGVNEKVYEANGFVKQLVSVVNTAASAVHEIDMEIAAPERTPTPYGGRLTWTCPGGNKIVAHLKDKVKIRHKKRWSQVMYMYYFLGFKLWAQETDPRRKQIQADNTFLLALDGDVDFQPKAVQLLVDLMKKDDKMGAACGRIHPIGNGPMVWYQKFEYALGHWMQKATEHVLGCVLCSPGCFSLFRGSAVMDDNVMKKYTTKSTEASHFIQYDQGEDRWLCTLLLQAGYRVEYSAASDSFTQAPEGLYEFYNQRRRWMPSTMANILDLLRSWRSTVKVNENISLLYIIYQATLFIAAVLGTGTIFLMIVGALVVSLAGAIDMWTSFFINLVPVIFYAFLCYKAKANVQLMVASVLTTVYALLQMLVLVGIIIQISEEGPTSPTALFFFYVTATFLLAAVIHPQEAYCVVHGFIYFLAIPSMYMLLMMYSMTNMHVVSWGTREVKQTKTEEEQAAVDEAAKEQERAAGDNQLVSLLGKIKGLEKFSGVWFNCCNIAKCLWCPKPAASEETIKFEAVLAKLDKMEEKMEEMSGSGEKKLKLDKFHIPHRIKSKLLRRKKVVSFKGEGDPSGGGETNSDDDKKLMADINSRDELVNPYWLESPDLGSGPMGNLQHDEKLFFQDLIDRYLYPLEKNKAEEERVSNDLIELRNQVSFAYFLVNGIFVVVVFTLQINVDKVSVPWPWGDNLKLEPIGFMFLIFFAIIMVLQTFGMIVHRMGTLFHIVATTKLNWVTKGRNQNTRDASDAVELARDLGRLRQDQDPRASVRSTLSDGGPDSATRELLRKGTVYRIGKSVQSKGQLTDNLDTAFSSRLSKLTHELDENKDTKQAVNKVIGKGKMTNKWKSVRAAKLLRDANRSRAGSSVSALNQRRHSGDGGHTGNDRLGEERPQSAGPSQTTQRTGSVSSSDEDVPKNTWEKERRTSRL